MIPWIFQFGGVPLSAVLLSAGSQVIRMVKISRNKFIPLECGCRTQSSGTGPAVAYRFVRACGTEQQYQ